VIGQSARSAGHLEVAVELWDRELEVLSQHLKNPAITNIFAAFRGAENI
jgi:hypothetical protein